jgi:hypothetical protein
MVSGMIFPAFRAARGVLWMLSALFLGVSLPGQTSEPVVHDPDSTALILARKYLEGGEESRAAILQALQYMGWSVRNAQGAPLKTPAAGTDTGLAMRDYELEELLWKPSEQPSIRLISFAQALAVPFEDADPEELAQDMVESLRKSAESEQPQQRFWARFIVALGRVSPANYDLTASAPIPVMQPSRAQAKELEREAASNPIAFMKAMAPTAVWPDDDPVLAPSPLPERDEDDPRTGSAERDRKRMGELSKEMARISEELGQRDEARQKAAMDKMAKVSAEMAAISQRQMAATMRQTSAAMTRMQKARDGEDEDEEESDGDDRFMAEWRDQPLSLMQVALITRVLSADLRQMATRGQKPAGTRTGFRTPRLAPIPLAMISVAQAAAPAPSFGDQFVGAIGDIWATTAGGYTSAVVEHYFEESRFNKGMAAANSIIAWYKTIMSVVQQKITIEVENAPLVRTKTRSPGEQRTARAKVVIDFPKSDVLKAIRAAGNITSLDLQMPDGGPVSGAKVVWRLPEGSYNGKYQTAKGGWEYRPDLAVVQFAQGVGYVSTTNASGEATITIEGVPQRKNLSPRVRPYPRRAAVGVEVTIKVGNMTQDLNDAISLAMGGPVSGSLTFLADMVLRTSFFFHASREFEVTDWKEPAWEGEFEITVKGSGSKHEKGEKGGPDQDYTWSMDRYIEGRLHTPDWEEENEQKKEYNDDGRHKLEIGGDSRYFRLKDSSSSRSKNSHNRYQADGPLQIQPPGHNQLARYSRAEPSGSAELMFTGGKMVLELKPFFGAECLVSRSEQNGGRTSNKAGPEYLSLLDGISPDGFTIIEENDGSEGFVEGAKTFDYYHGNLPYVPGFDVVVTVKYRLWKNGPPPRSRR